MNNTILSRANELSDRIDEIDRFIHTYEATWKQGKLRIVPFMKQLYVGHRGYGYYSSSEIITDKALSEKIYQALTEYRSEIKKEFAELGEGVKTDE